MSGETEADISGWTVDTLHSHIRNMMDERDRRYEQRFDAADHAVESALAAAEKASDKADAATDKRFDGVNEFRQTLSDQARTFMPRAEAETWTQRVERLEHDAAGATGHRGGLAEFGGYLVGVLGVVAAVVIALLR